MIDEMDSIALHETMELVDRSLCATVTVTFEKELLKKLIRSHLLHLAELKRDLEGRKYAH